MSYRLKIKLEQLLKERNQLKAVYDFLRPVKQKLVRQSDLTSWLDGVAGWGGSNAKAVREYRDGHFGV